jgi:hypothetical protein
MNINKDSKIFDHASQKNVWNTNSFIQALRMWMLMMAMALTTSQNATTGLPPVTGDNLRVLCCWLSTNKMTKK